MILKFSLVISLVCNKDTDIEALVPASVSHHCLVLSILFSKFSNVNFVAISSVKLFKS